MFLEVFSWVLRMCLDPGGSVLQIPVLHSFLAHLDPGTKQSQSALEHTQHAGSRASMFNLFLVAVFGLEDRLTVNKSAS